MKQKIENANIIAATKVVYVVWTNTDLTEGRGEERPVCVCSHYETAKRNSIGKGVMGTNARVEECIAVKLSGQLHWLIPGVICRPTKEDLLKTEMVAAFKAVTEKARKMGLSEEDIAVLQRGRVE